MVKLFAEETLMVFNFEITPEEKAAYAIEVATVTLLLARDNISLCNSKEQKELNILMTESLMEFIDFDYLDSISKHVEDK